MHLFESNKQIRGQFYLPLKRFNLILDGVNVPGVSKNRRH